MKITNQLFLDYLECNYRGHLRLTDSAGSTSEFSDFANTRLRDYQIRACRLLQQQFATEGLVVSSPPSPFPLTEDFVLATDVAVAHSDIVAHIDAIVRASEPNAGIYIPVMFAYEEKLRKHQKLLLAFWANVLARQQGTEVSIGKIVHGVRFRTTKVTVEPLLNEADRIVRNIRELTHAGDAPRMFLNSHCPTCEFCDRCHGYWDYQRDQVYVRSSQRIKCARKTKQRKKRRSLRINQIVGPTRRWECPKCQSRKIAKYGRHTKLLNDLRFVTGGVKRWITKYVVEHYDCRHCGARFPSDTTDWTRHRFGRQFLAYVIHSLVELHLPQLKIAQSVNRLFGYSISQSYINRLKVRAAEDYRETYEHIKLQLVNGQLIHADETQLRTKEFTGYVWVFTSMEEVVYLWSKTRHGQLARDFLDGFSGVLVSDFYSAYDAIKCPQQRCLIHLIRDLNSDILKNPFNNELKELVGCFAAVLKHVIETVDRFGLKRRFLSKHRKDVAAFYDNLVATECRTDVARKVQQRLRKNRGRLFTFLDHDGVPWNNNNAEHAIKAFAQIRKVIQGNTNERGIRDYLILLSIFQTCVYKGIDFLDFLRSGEKCIDAYSQTKRI